MMELISYYSINGNYVMSQFFRHFLMSFYGVLFAAIVSIPLGFFIARRKRLGAILISVANVIQTIPTLALLSVLMIGLGLGPNTVVMSVFLYSILPILSNTYTAVRNIDKTIIDVAKGLGMTRAQMIMKVELPLSLSVILGGVRNAIVIAIGITAVGTFIGAGGLGDIITRGINITDGGSVILAGALPTALMAVMSDWILGIIEDKLSYTS